MTATIRLFQWQDIPAVVDVMNEYAVALGSTRRLTVEEVELRWRTPYNHPDRDCFVAVTDHDRILGFTIADLLDDLHRAVGIYNVPPEHINYAPSLIHVAVDHFVSTSSERTLPGEPLTMQWRISDKDADGIALLESEGCENVRAFYTMHVKLDQPIDPVPLPEGLTLRLFTPDQLEKVFQAKTEIFLDHWGEQDQTLEEWRIDMEQPEFDPSLWWIAYSGDEVAGVLLSSHLNPISAWVDTVGVRREWRRHGLAYALLRGCFAEYQRRGWQRVALGVDSNSSTRAVAVYERAGMSIDSCQLYYEKLLHTTPAAHP